MEKEFQAKQNILNFTQTCLLSNNHYCFGMFLHCDVVCGSYNKKSGGIIFGLGEITGFTTGGLLGIRNMGAMYKAYKSK